MFSTSASRCKIWIGPEADIVHVADTYWNGIHPFIDYSTGGSIDGMITASEANLMATTDQTIIIPGHGRPVSNRAELKKFRDMLVTVRDNVAKLKRQGRSLDETLARMSNRSLPNSQWPRCEMTNRS